MANYINTINGQVLTECELYDFLMCGCSAKYYVKWKWENEDTNVIHTGREWREIWEVKPPNCSCADPNCPLGRRLIYRNTIDDVTCVNGSDILRVTLNTATYVDLTSDPPLAPDYIIDWGDGSPTESIVVGVESTHDVSGLAEAYYYGTITWQDATFEFWYYVRGGGITKLQLSRTLHIAYEIGCELYPDYTITVTDDATIENLGIATSNIKVYLTSVSNVNYAPEVQTYSESGTLTTDLTNADHTINCAYEATGLGSSMNNIGVLRFGCNEL